MYDNINVLHEIIENVRGGKIPGDDHREQVSVFRSMDFHLTGFGLGPRCPSDLDPSFEEKVYDVGAHKTCGACNKNVAEIRVILGQDLLRLQGIVLTEEQSTLRWSLVWMRYTPRAPPPPYIP